MVRAQYLEEADRLAQRIFNEHGTIETESEFNTRFNSLVDVPESELSGKQKQFRQDVQDEFSKTFSPRLAGDTNESLFKRAGGTDLRRDRQRTAKTVVKTEQEFIRKGAKRVDLQGLDTKRTLGRSRGKTVLVVRRDKVIVKGKKVTRFRDKKGRFVKVK